MQGVCHLSVLGKQMNMSELFGREHAWSLSTGSDISQFLFSGVRIRLTSLKSFDLVVDWMKKKASLIYYHHFVVMNQVSRTSFCRRGCPRI